MSVIAGSTVWKVVEPAITATLYSGHLYITTILTSPLGTVIAGSTV